MSVVGNSLDLHDMAVEMADDYAKSTVECSGHYVRNSIGRLLWYEMKEEDLADYWVSRAVVYLEKRRLLVRNPKNHNQVKVKK